MLNSIRNPAATVGMPGESSWQSFMDQYVNNWSAVQAALAQMGTGAELLGGLGTNPLVAAPPGDTTIIKERGGGGGGRRNRDTGFVGGGYAQPGQVNSGMGKWAPVVGAINGGGVDVDRAARKAARNGGTYVEEPKDRTRERSRTHTSKDGTTTTTTNINISRNGGTAIATDSGSDGNNRQRKKKKNSEMIY